MDRRMSATKQNLTFAGVNAHHQNGIAEQRIRELQEIMRAMLIHASKQWPGVVTIHLWPYATRMANQAYNAMPLSSHPGKQSPNKLFDNSTVDINQKHWKPFRCPVYVLKAEHQGTTGIHPEWDARSRAGVYMGQSPVDNRKMALVLIYILDMSARNSMLNSTKPSEPFNKTNGMQPG